MDAQHGVSAIKRAGVALAFLFAVSLALLLLLIGSGRPAISDEGRYVPFHSSSTNLVPANTNAGLDTDGGSFDFKRQLFGNPSTLSLSVTAASITTGEVTINGADTRGPTTPFTFDWGDGQVSDGWFPQHHTYSDVTRNHLVTVTAHYSGGETDSREAVVWFVAPTINPIPLPSDVSVTIPDHLVTLVSRMPGYQIPGTLTYFDETFFDAIPRSTIEYILTVAASIQKDFANDDVYLIDGGFPQVVLRDPSFGGMYSLWYTSPVSFGVGDSGFQGTIEYSSLMHEMGHNVSLNSPADYHYGGKIDGNANAIFSETMAQIFQHATVYEMINNAAAYGFGEDLALDIKQSATASMLLVRSSYDRYVSSGKRFSSWNDPATPEDETFDSFMTIAYKFFEHAENSGLGYRVPLKRMMEFLQVFDADLEQRYDRLNDSLEGSAFRATLMVAALSYAFSADLRNEFRDLDFPINDEVYGELYGRLDGDTPTPTPTLTPTVTPTATPPTGATRTLVWSPGWHNETWSGASTSEEAFACAAGSYAAAYRYVNGGLERYFPDRPDISNMGPLEQYSAFLILITGDVTCEMPMADPPGTERTLEWAVGWHNEGWTGPDGTAPQDAFACADGNYAAAYRYVDSGLERYFPDRPDISNMGPLSKYDAFLILVTAPVSCRMPIAP